MGWLSAHCRILANIKGKKSLNDDGHLLNFEEIIYDRGNEEVIVGRKKRDSQLESLFISFDKIAACLPGVKDY